MNLNAVWRVSFTDLCAVGDNGTIIHKPATPETGTINRLLCEHRKTEAGATIYKIEYIFDDTQAKNGNIHKVIYDGNNITEFQYNEMNELTGITHPDTTTETLTYDNNGNLTQTTRNSETTSYQWDCHDRLIKVTLPPGNGAEAGEEISFTYDGEDKLTKITYPDMSVDMKQSGIDTLKRIAHIKFNGMKTNSEINIATHLVHISGKLLAQYDSKPASQSPQFYHYDHNNNLALITDQHGNITEKPLMDAYGNFLPLPDSQGNKQAKTLSSNLLTGGAGVFYLHRVKMYNMRRRFYSDLSRIFISADPLSSYSTYFNYANNHPVSFSDPSGLIAISKAPIFWDDVFDIKIDGISIKQKIKNVLDNKLNGINTKALQGNTVTKNWLDVFCNNCMSELTKNQVYKLIKKASIRFDYTGFCSYKGLAFENPNFRKEEQKKGILGIYLCPLVLIQDDDVLATIIVHELAHLQDCNLPGGGVWRHGCCDYIAKMLGYNSHKLLWGEEKKEKAKKLRDSFKEKIKRYHSKAAYDRILSTMQNIIDKPYTKEEKDMQLHPYKRYLDKSIHYLGWQPLEEHCDRRNRKKRKKKRG